MDTEEQKREPSLGRVAFWLGLLIMAYFFSTGPVTRFWPGVADKIYAPLSPLADNKVIAPVLTRWLALWGVK